MAAGFINRRNPATYLTDDLVVEILSRLPAKSLCRFKCVSKHWGGIISHPDHRKKLPQTLAVPGFFYRTYNRDRFPESIRHFTNVTGRGPPLIHPSLSFLPGYVDITILDCCNGRLLCRSWKTAGATRYIICNPATEEWTTLPESNQGICDARLGFDPAFSPHFCVFELLETEPETIYDYVYVDGLEIYSSETREWVHKENGWSDDAGLSNDPSTVFLNGFLHMFAYRHLDVLVVDTQGKAWRTIPVPHGNDDGFIGLSQGHLYYLNTVEEHGFKLTIYVLEDYGTNEWIFKHSVSTTEMLGVCCFGLLQHYCLIALHPESHLIFFISDLDNTIRCCNMEHGKVNVICNMGCALEGSGLKRFLAYAPLFSVSSGWD